MFDISWSELLILGIVTLIFVGPKELPVLMRTIGRYAGIVRRHATEFRSQFDEAMREAEFEELRKEITSVGDDIKKSVSEVETSAASIKTDIDREVAVAAKSAEAAPAPVPATLSGKG